MYVLICFVEYVWLPGYRVLSLSHISHLQKQFHGYLPPICSFLFLLTSSLTPLVCTSLFSPCHLSSLIALRQTSVFDHGTLSNQDRFWEMLPFLW